MIDGLCFLSAGKDPRQARKQTNKKNPSSCGQWKERNKQKEAREREKERPK
jgi:hypothetical protein